jgi:4-hydroxybenzoyl-CoA reductase subunit beta
MRLPRFDYRKPSGLEECLDLLQEHGGRARLLSGGTDLLMNMKYRVAKPDLVIGIKGLQEVSQIVPDEKGYCNIGASVTLSEIVAHKQIASEFPSFHKAVQSVASKHIRNMGTLGGNICLDTRCWYYNKTKWWRDAREVCHKMGGRECHAIKGSPRCHAINSSDTVPALISLGARARIVSKGQERVVQLKDFFQDNGAHSTVLAPEEMVSAILIPRDNSAAVTTFIKTAMRKGIDFSMGSIAGFFSYNGKSQGELRLVINCISSAPISLKKTVQVIAEDGFTDAAIEMAALTARSELGALTNVFTSAGYKRHLAEVLVKRALNELKDHSGKNRSR